MSQEMMMLQIHVGSGYLANNDNLLLESSLLSDILPSLLMAYSVFPLNAKKVRICKVMGGRYGVKKIFLQFFKQSLQPIV